MTDRVFLVCHSKNCTEAKRSRKRCTISCMETAAFSSLDKYLNKRMFCVLYTNEFIIKSSNTPNWKFSTEKPGLRKITESAKKSDASFLVENPEFLEV
jgi:hypothetical protein